MKSLTKFKIAFSKSKKEKSKSKAFNKAYLNLSNYEFAEFISWVQSKYGN
jgi:hypothetical protein